jgi:hypothetical protein
MDYFAGIDISVDETYICVLDREGMVVRERKTASTAEATAVELAKVPSCRRIVFESGEWRRSRSTACYAIKKQLLADQRRASRWKTPRRATLRGRLMRKSPCRRAGSQNLEVSRPHRARRRRPSGLLRIS